MTATSSAAVQRGPAFHRREARKYYVYLIPALIAFGVIVFAPFVMNFIYSLEDWNGGLATPSFIGIGNYIELMGDQQFWVSFRNVGAMIVALVVVPNLLGILIAAVLFDYIGRVFGGRAASFFRATYYLPQVVPIAVAGIAWNWILSADDGVVNSFLEFIGVRNPPNWLGDPHIALEAIMLVLIWGQIGFPVVVFMGALQRVDPSLYEAASIDGASWLQRFRAITIPQIRPEIFVVSLLAAIGALKVFGPIFVLTNGGPEGSTYVPSYYSYDAFFSLSRVGYGAAIANILTALILILAFVMIIVQSRVAREDEE